MNKNAIDFEVMHCYLDSGLVPVSSFSPEGVKSFLKLLESLSEDDQRQAKRKFRKKWRKLLKKLDSAQAFDLRNDSEITPILRARRRRAVHRSIMDEIGSRENNG